jgi:hypothetical protein
MDPFQRILEMNHMSRLQSVGICIYLSLYLSASASVTVCHLSASLPVSVPSAQSILTTPAGAICSHDRFFAFQRILEIRRIDVFLHIKAFSVRERGGRERGGGREGPHSCISILIDGH